MMASNLKLSNLTVFVDLNDRISLAKLSQDHAALFPVPDKFEMFGWATQEVDGHDSTAIYNAVHQSSENKPRVIVCNTTKGKGVSFMEDVPVWHYRAPNEDEYQTALSELNVALDEVVA